MRTALAAIAAVTLTVAATHARAEGGEVIRLPDSTRDAVVAAAANGPEKPAVYTPEQAAQESVLNRSLYPEFYGKPGTNGGPALRDGKVHGEMTMFAGTGGMAGFSGTAVMPVGKNSTAMVSVMQGTSRYGGMQGFGFGFSSGGSDSGPSLGISGSFGNPYGYGYGYPAGYGYGSPFGYGGMMGWGGGFGRFRRHW